MRRLGWPPLRVHSYRPQCLPRSRHSYERAAIENSTLHTIRKTHVRSCPRHCTFRNVSLPKTAREGSLASLPPDRTHGLVEGVGQTLGSHSVPVFRDHPQRAFRYPAIRRFLIASALRRPQAALPARHLHPIFAPSAASFACFPHGWFGPLTYISSLGSAQPYTPQHIPHSRIMSYCPRHGPALRCVYVPRPHGSYRRFGEASHPGPIVRMPGDGHCLYHALAWWLGGTAHALRQRLATLTEAQWNQFMPCNTPELLQQFRLETADRTQWGGALQIAAAAAMYQVSFHVHSPFGVHVIGAGTQCHLWYSTAPVGHYDVWTEEPPPGPLPVSPSTPPQSAAPLLAEPALSPVPSHRPTVRLPPPLV